MIVETSRTFVSSSTTLCSVRWADTQVHWLYTTPLNLKGKMQGLWAEAPLKSKHKWVMWTQFIFCIYYAAVHCWLLTCLWCRSALRLADLQQEILALAPAASGSLLLNKHIKYFADVNNKHVYYINKMVIKCQMIHNMVSGSYCILHSWGHKYWYLRAVDCRILPGVQKLQL